VLGIVNPRDVVKRLNPVGVVFIYTSTTSGIRSVTFISEGNLYRLVAQSRKPEAIVFEDWIFGERACATQYQGGR
jgi:prophage antirepressor-like protein